MRRVRNTRGPCDQIGVGFFQRDEVKELPDDVAAELVKQPRFVYDDEGHAPLEKSDDVGAPEKEE